jgi:hypothetical protein
MARHHRQHARRARSPEFAAIVNAIRDSRIAANELVSGAQQRRIRPVAETRALLRTRRRNLFEQSLQILKHCVFFFRARVICDRARAGQHMTDLKI